MQIITTPVEGVAIIELELKSDDRGFFARAFDRQLFAEAGLNPTAEQCNISFNHKAGTLRGMHYQLAWAPETKLVRCTRGAIVDIVVDMREDSPTYLQHIEVELSADNRRALYVLYAFNLEVSRTRELSREPMPGEIRLQWWRDALGGAGRGEVDAHPVASTLRGVVVRYGLPPRALLELIDARSFDLYDEPMPSLAHLERYAAQTSSAPSSARTTLSGSPVSAAREWRPRVPSCSTPSPNSR